MRKTMDKLISRTGLVVAAVLLVAGGLLTRASTFIENNVTERLRAQHITMPVAAAFPEGHEQYLEPYAGQPMERPAGQGVRRPLHPRPHGRVERWQDLLGDQRPVHEDEGRPERRPG